MLKRCFFASLVAGSLLSCGSGGAPSTPTYSTGYQQPGGNDQTPLANDQAPSSDSQSPTGSPGSSNICTDFCTICPENGCEAQCQELLTLLQRTNCGPAFENVITCAMALPEVACESNDLPGCQAELEAYLACAETVVQPRRCSLEGDGCQGCEDTCATCYCSGLDQITCADVCAATGTGGAGGTGGI